MKGIYRLLILVTLSTVLFIVNQNSDSSIAHAVVPQSSCYSFYTDQAPCSTQPVPDPNNPGGYIGCNNVSQNFYISGAGTKVLNNFTGNCGPTGCTGNISQAVDDTSCAPACASEGEGCNANCCFGLVCRSGVCVDQETGASCQPACVSPYFCYEGVCTQWSPVVVDVAGDGISLTNGVSGVAFDINGDGARERLSWDVLQR